MKQTIDANTDLFRQRRSAQLAEKELKHLELILANYIEPTTATDRFPSGYWDKRIAQLDTDYELVPTQSHRVASLQRKLAMLESAIEAASLEEERQNRRAAA